MHSLALRLAMPAFVLAGALTIPAGAAYAVPDAEVVAANSVADLVGGAAPTSIDSAVPQADIDGALVIGSEESAVAIPESPQDPVVFGGTEAGSDDAVGIGLPATESNAEAEVSRDGTVVYADNDGAVDVAVQATAANVRVTTVLNDASAPREFAYDIDGATPVLLPDGGVELRQDVELELPDGSTTVRNVPGVVAEAPWAKDANGNNVPTHYEIRGAAVVQVVDVSEDTAFPVVADPNWIKIAKCSAAVAYVVFTSAFLVGKSAAMVKAVKAGLKFVKAVGGARQAAKLVVGASTAAERTAFYAKARSIAGTSIMDFLGITMIRNNCF